MDRPPFHPEDPLTSMTDHGSSFPRQQLTEEIPQYRSVYEVQGSPGNAPLVPKEHHAPFTERYRLVPETGGPAPAGSLPFPGIPQQAPRTNVPKDVSVPAPAVSLRIPASANSAHEDFPFPHSFTAEMIDPANGGSALRGLFLNTRFLSNLFCDLLDVFSTMCLGAIVGGSLVLGCGILYDHLKANRNAITKMIEVKEKQAAAIQKVKQEIQRLKNELFKDHQSVIVNGALGRQATGYLSALILEKNRIRREAAYKTRLSQTFEDTLKILQDNLEGLGTRTALLNAREQIRNELDAVCLKEQRANEIEASLREQIADRVKKIEKAGFSEMSVSQVKRLVNDAHNRLNGIQRTMADLTPRSPDTACDKNVPGQSSVLMWTDFD